MTEDDMESNFASSDATPLNRASNIFNTKALNGLTLRLGREFSFNENQNPNSAQ
jgi:hypothetical protein